MIMTSNRDAADAVLDLMAREGLVEQAEHTHGGKVWAVNGKLFGRTDGITHKIFEPVKKGKRK